MLCTRCRQNEALGTRVSPNWCETCFHEDRTQRRLAGTPVGGLCIACHKEPASRPWVNVRSRTDEEFALRHPPRWCSQCYESGRWRELFSDILEPLAAPVIFTGADGCEEDTSDLDDESDEDDNLLDI